MERRTFVKLLILNSGALILNSSSLLGSTFDQKYIKIVMIYNNIGRNDNFVNGWGLSIWIEDKDTAVLFDVGGDPSIFWKNVEKSGIDIKKLSKIVISHNHWDHVEGLSVILEKTHYRPDVYVPNFDLENLKGVHPKASLIGIKEPVQISKSLWSTGQLKGEFRGGVLREQSINIIQDDFVLLLTGCSHPGIVEIVKRTKRIHPDKKLKLVIGGFHLIQHSMEQIQDISTSLNSLQVDKLAPSHCTGELAINVFKEDWGERFIDFENGSSMKI